MEVCVLGPVEVVLGGQPVDLGTPKQRALVAALALARGWPVSVDTIIQTDGPILFSAPLEDREETAAVLDRLGATWNEHGGLGKRFVVKWGHQSG